VHLLAKEVVVGMTEKRCTKCSCFIGREFIAMLDVLEVSDVMKFIFEVNQLIEYFVNLSVCCRWFVCKAENVSFDSKVQFILIFF